MVGKTRFFNTLYEAGCNIQWSDHCYVLAQLHIVHVVLRKIGGRGLPRFVSENQTIINWPIGFTYSFLPYSQLGYHFPDLELPMTCIDYCICADTPSHWSSQEFRFSLTHLLAATIERGRIASLAFVIQYGGRPQPFLCRT